MSFFQRITMLQSEPFDLGSDDVGRQMARFNFMATKTRSATSMLEYVRILTTAGVGVLGTNIFTSSAATLPAGNGPYLVIAHTGGTAPRQTHNEAKPDESRPTASVTVHAQTYSAAFTMAMAAYDAFSAVVNRTVNP